MIAASQSRGSDEIELQLVEFYRREVPAPWPTLRAPVKSPVAVHQQPSSVNSRAALAVSVAILLVGGWLLSGRLPAPAPSAGSLDNGNATVPSELRSGNRPLHPRR